MNEEEFEQRLERRVYARLQHDPVWLYGDRDEAYERAIEFHDAEEARLERELRDERYAVELYDDGYPDGFDEQYDIDQEA